MNQEITSSLKARNIIINLNLTKLINKALQQLIYKSSNKTIKIQRMSNYLKKYFKS